ncbi:hypothetical protein FHS31_003248 [Sphingomonas vulcanisoli]|uniref:Uncharacterized protein n=1 Tax=Sphingomonas vulcanisoli TaxID=1658060 RepID=A0ABX0U134_9SPHN|nr:hypothetical protein [Sphingomonas vulcanisoli]NIJ09611.1 hypothetical protein [Sphingomonas vulcanisoli]
MFPLIVAALAATGAAAPAPAASRADGSFEIAQLVVRSHVVVRIETAQAALPPAFVTLKEKKGPKCIPRDTIVGAAVLAGNSVDFILRGNTRLRARFSNSCPALDFYAGFYLDQRQDGQICAGRDVIHSRAGGECEINRFRLMIPVPAK